MSGAPESPPTDYELQNTFDSPEGLAEAFLKAMALDDTDALRELALTEDEFRNLVWPRLPASRPERNTPFDFIWGDLRQKSMNALRFTHRDFAGQTMDLVEVRFDGETTDYDWYRVHRDARTVVQLEDGREVELDLFGSVIEFRSRFKIFSFVTD